MSQLSMFESDQGIGSVETWCRRQEIRWIVGVDEAGRGPLAGPVYTAAVAFDLEQMERDWIEDLDDSKKLELEQREQLFEHIRADVPARSIEQSDPELIDEINILEATREAMVAAVDSVEHQLDSTPDCILVDGDNPIDVKSRQRTVVDGDALSYAIAAASILAKVARDRFMVECGERWPAYGFASNKGYPTPDHRRALKEHGPCPIHRRSFGSVPS